MAKLCTWLTIFSLVPHLALAQSPTVRDEAREALTLEAGLSSFKKVQELNAKCVSTNESYKFKFLIIVAGVARLSAEASERKATLKATGKFVDSLVAADSASRMEMIDKVGRAGGSSSFATKTRFSKGAMYVYSAVFAAAMATGLYNIFTDKDLYSKETFIEYRDWLEGYVSRKKEKSELAEYFSTKDGYWQFLNMKNENDIKDLMSLNPKLVLITVAMEKVLSSKDCTDLSFSDTDLPFAASQN